MPIAPLRTKRLLLRPLGPDDLGAVFDIVADPETTADVSWGLHTFEEAEGWLDRRLAQEQQYGFSMWGIELQGTGELVGFCGFFPHDAEEIELGYVVKAPLWGRGFATEAASCAVAAAVAAGYRIYATIRSTNVASLRVASRLGLRPDGERKDERGTLLVFRKP